MSESSRSSQAQEKLGGLSIPPTATVPGGSIETSASGPAPDRKAHIRQSEMARITVLIVCYDLKDGGSPRVVSMLLPEIDRSAFDPVLIMFSAEEAFRVPADIPRHVLSVKGGGNLLHKIKNNLTAVFRLRRILSKLKPDVALGMGGITNWVLLIASLLNGLKVPIIIGEHGAGAFEMRTDRLTIQIQKMLIGALYPLAERIIAISPGVRQYLVNVLHVPEGKIASITNPVDLQQIRVLAQEKAGHPWLDEPDKPVILWVGRLVPLKGLKHLVASFEKVLKQIDARLVLVGEGPEEVELQRLVAALQLQERVAFVGFRSNPYPFMARASLFVLPSLGGEAFGMVLAEAMACGTPVVATDCVTGPAEVLKNGDCGLLVPVGDEPALTKAIVRALSDQKLRASLIAKASQRVLDFNPERVARAYEDLFRGCINS